MFGLPHPMNEPLFYVALLFLVGGAVLAITGFFMLFKLHVARCKKRH